MTKRRDLLKLLAAHASKVGEPFIVKEGGSHTRVWIGERYTTVPRHADIPEWLAAKILKQIGVEK